MNEKDIDYDALAARLTAPGQPLPAAEEVRVGEAAAAGGREFMVSQYGSWEAVEEAIRAGRPRLGGGHGPSPVARTRVTVQQDAALSELEAETGKKRSELLRDAIDLLLASRHKLAS
ncbi:hypothetical protein [Sinomonas soli]